MLIVLKYLGDCVTYAIKKATIKSLSPIYLPITLSTIHPSISVKEHLLGFRFLKCQLGFQLIGLQGSVSWLKLDLWIRKTWFSNLTPSLLGDMTQDNSPLFDWVCFLICKFRIKVSHFSKNNAILIMKKSQTNVIEGHPKKKKKIRTP